MLGWKTINHIKSLLNKAVLTCKASLAASTSLHPPKPLEAKEYIAPGQKLKQQPQGFSKTTLTPGRKKNGLVLRYSAPRHKCPKIVKNITPTIHVLGKILKALYTAL